MSITTKIVMDLAPLLSHEVGKYEEIILAHVSKTLNDLNIEGMIEQITMSLISQQINKRMHQIINQNDRINELIAKKIKESLEGVDIQELMQTAAKGFIENVIKDKYSESY